MNICPNSFNNLSLSSKSANLWENGELMFTRRHQGSYIKLYLLGSFFVEVYYDTVSLQIEKIIMLDSSAKLDWYERFIELPESILTL